MLCLFKLLSKRPSLRQRPRLRRARAAQPLCRHRAEAGRSGDIIIIIIIMMIIMTSMLIIMMIIMNRMFIVMTIMSI